MKIGDRVHIGAGRTTYLIVGQHPATGEWNIRRADRPDHIGIAYPENRLTPA